MLKVEYSFRKEFVTQLMSVLPRDMEDGSTAEAAKPMDVTVGDFKLI